MSSTQSAVGTKANQHKVSSVSFDGDFRVREWILRNEVELSEGAEFDSITWQIDRKRLATLGVFSEVLTDTSLDSAGVQIGYTLNEVWTLIPLVNVGGDVDNIDLDLGFEEKDFMGLYMEIGFLYTRFERRDSYSGWIFWPRAFGTKYELGLSGYSNHEREPAYVAGEELSADYDVREAGGTISLSKRIAERLVVGGSCSYQTEKWKLQSPAASYPTLRDVWRQKRIRPSVGLTLGRVYYDNFFFDGSSLSLRGDLIAFDLDDYSPKFWLASIQALKFINLEDRWNIGLRGVYGKSRIRDVLPAFALSGFGNVRGAGDRKRRGSSTFYSNNEVRYRVYQNKWLHSQIVAFADLGSVWEDNWSVRQIADETLFSVGAGVRLGLVRFYKAIGRVDAAYSLRDGSWTLYIAAGQFF